jgi:hypothetical protein
MVFSKFIKSEKIIMQRTGPFNNWIRLCYNECSGDDRLRRERLVPDCEPRGTELVKSVQKIKCQKHLLRPPARCLTQLEVAIHP